MAFRTHVKYDLVQKWPQTRTSTVHTPCGSTVYESIVIFITFFSITFVIATMLLIVLLNEAVRLLGT